MRPSMCYPQWPGRVSSLLICCQSGSSPSGRHARCAAAPLPAQPIGAPRALASPARPSAQAKALRAEDAFPFEELMATGRLLLARQLAELEAPLRQPCVVVTSQLDLSVGDAPQLLQRWRKEAAT